MMSGSVSPWQIYLGVGINSVFIALLEPSFKATITDLLTKEQFAKASGLVQIAGSSKFLLSPFLAGLLLGVTDIRGILVIDITTILVTIPITLLIKRWLGPREAKADEQSFFADFVEGWRTISTNNGLLWMILLISVGTFYVGFLQTLFTPLVLTITDAKTLGAVESASAVGMLVSSMLLGTLTITRKYVNQFVLGSVAAGAFIILFGLTMNIVVITASGFLFFASLPFINTGADVLIRANIPDDKQGRAWGLIGILSQFGYIIAYAVSGALADYVFNPLLVEGGALAPTVGRIVGVGEGRGIGLMLIISGALFMALGLVMARIPSIRALEKNALA
jgi:MFS family permease